MSTETVFTFRVHEVFRWDEDTLGLPAASEGDLAVFRTNPLGLRAATVASPVVGHQYWVMCANLHLTPEGDLNLGGLNPIESDAIVIKYDELARAEDGTLQRTPALLRLPLSRYRECLQPRHGSGERILEALWECRSKGPAR
jgi:hypothetical protein